MKKRLLIIGGIIVVLIIVGVFIYHYVFHPNHRDIAAEVATTSISATELHKQFAENETHANANYLDQTIMISGAISSMDHQEVILDDKIQINLSSEATQLLESGMLTQIKGRCLGFDELLEVVKIDQAIINQQNQTP